MPNSKPTGIAYSDPNFDSLSLGGAAVQSTAAEINKLANVTNGVTQANKAVVLGASKQQDQLTVGPAGTAITQIRVFSPSLSPAAVAANTTAEQTFAVAGLTTTDKVFVNKPTAQAGLGIVGMRVSAVDTLAITFSNNTAAAITPTAAEAYQVVALRS